MLRREQLPPLTLPPPVALLTALGYLQGMHDGEAVEGLDELATNAGILPAEMMPLIDRAEERGYLSVDDDGSLRLTQEGWRLFLCLQALGILPKSLIVYDIVRMSYLDAAG